jgi:membrane protein implicated in regulation of membrane protease activity
MDFLDSLEPHWVWITLGLLLAGLEMLVPGVYLIWFAVAAIITGVLTGLFDLSFALQIVDFVFLALIAVFSARRFLKDRPIVSPDPLLNQRGTQLIGQTARVVEAIEHGTGRIHIGDSEWNAIGPDADVGDRVRVTGSQGTALLVEPLNLIGEQAATDEA